MKYTKEIGIIACVVLIIACFLPWAFYPAINETFTGFHVKKFANGNYYGRPGMLITFFAVCSIILFYLPKLWAKRVNIFLAAFLSAYIYRTYRLFTGSIVEGEVEARIGIWIVILVTLVILICSVFPNDIVLEQSRLDDNYEKDDNKDSLPVIVGSILLFISLFVSFSNKDIYQNVGKISTYFLIFELGIRILITIWVQKIARSKTKNWALWGLFSFILPSIALISIGLKRNRLIK